MRHLKTLMVAVAGLAVLGGVARADVVGYRQYSVMPAGQTNQVGFSETTFCAPGSAIFVTVIQDTKFIARGVTVSCATPAEWCTAQNLSSGLMQQGDSAACRGSQARYGFQCGIGTITAGPFNSCAPPK